MGQCLSRFYSLGTVKNNLIAYSKPSTQNVKNEYDNKMTWSDDKITVGFQHAHPFDSAPSITDAFNVYSRLYLWNYH